PLLSLDTLNTRVGLFTSAPTQRFQINDAATAAFVVTSAGQVGIGTTNPANAKLVVGGSSNTGEAGRGGAGQFYGVSTVNQGVIAIWDTTALATGIGGRILFGSIRDENPELLIFGSIGGAKENATSGNNAGALVFRTAANGANEAEAMRITSTGNVGIGTTSPDTKLQVSGGNIRLDNGQSITFVNAVSAANINASISGNDGTDTLTFRVADVVRMTINGAGNVIITGNCSDAAGGGGCTADYAEVYHRDPADQMEMGDILALNIVTGKVTRATSGDKNNLIGAFSSSPGSLIGQRKDSIQLGVGKGVMKTLDPDEIPVALVGRVPVKVNLEGGAIGIGDRITSSSVLGVGMKATTSGQTVGIALEPFDGTQNFGTSTPKILVFVNLGYSKLDSEVTQNSGGWIVDQATGRVKSSYALEVPAIFASSGKWSIDENGKLIVREIETQKLTVTGPQGITIYDEDTGTPYCLKMKSGQIVSVSGTCVFAPSAPSASSTSPAPADTTPPTITILGNNPAVIEVGASYADMGVNVTDNIDQNLGYTASLDGGLALPQGAGLSLDTSTTTTHTILYTATDQAGNTASTTRTVNVVE
ncbi:MAG: DUF5011 domain-containing protein, partial [bacterium]|nr:DUF5011 domain-containing protein [bacterium]